MKSSIRRCAFLGALLLLGAESDCSVAAARWRRFYLEPDARHLCAPVERLEPELQQLVETCAERCGPSRTTVICYDKCLGNRLPLTIRVLGFLEKE